jgi:hypothetical protein
MRTIQRIVLPIILALALAPLSAAIAADRGALKHHPGHYVSLNHSDDAASVMPGLVLPGVRGVQIRYAWKQLEPERGRYDFSRIEADLELARRLGLQLVAFIEDKSFFTEEHHLPAYLDAYVLPFKRGGMVAKRWDPVIVERLGALFSALGGRFDTDPHFEGIALQESAMGFTSEIETLHGYTPEKYRDALIAILRSARRGLPGSQIFWYMNFLEGKQAYLADVAEIAAEERIAMGGPDVLPERASLARLTYPLYARFAGRMTLFCSIQNDSYAHRRESGAGSSRYWTLEELLLFAREQLHVSYLFWNRKYWRKPPDSWNWDDATKVIRAYPRLQPEPVAGR